MRCLLIWFDARGLLLVVLMVGGEVWLEGLFDTPLGQRALSVLPVVYRFWASARMVQLEE